MKPYLIFLLVTSCQWIHAHHEEVKITEEVLEEIINAASKI